MNVQADPTHTKEEADAMEEAMDDAYYDAISGLSACAAAELAGQTAYQSQQTRYDTYFDEPTGPGSAYCETTLAACDSLLDNEIYCAHLAGASHKTDGDGNNQYGDTAYGQKDFTSAYHYWEMAKADYEYALADFESVTEEDGYKDDLDALIYLAKCDMDELEYCLTVMGSVANLQSAAVDRYNDAMAMYNQTAGEYATAVAYYDAASWKPDTLAQNALKNAGGYGAQDDGNLGEGADKITEGDGHCNDGDDNVDEGDTYFALENWSMAGFYYLWATYDYEYGCTDYIVAYSNDVPVSGYLEDAAQSVVSFWDRAGDLD
jgi:hypothetical protein